MASKNEATQQHTMAAYAAHLKHKKNPSGKWSVETMGAEPTSAQLKAAAAVAGHGNVHTLAIACMGTHSKAKPENLGNGVGRTSDQIEAMVGQMQANKRRQLIAQGLLESLDLGARECRDGRARKVYAHRFIEAKATGTKRKATAKRSVKAKAKATGNAKS